MLIHICIYIYIFLCIYRIGVLSFICFTPIKNKDIKNTLYPTMQDYYYNQLQMICHPLNKYKHQFINEYQYIYYFNYLIVNWLILQSN